MKISLNRINQDYLFEAKSSNDLTVLMDNKSKTEGKVEGISPMEVLLMGVAGCSSIDIVAILNKQRINPVTLRMEVEGIRDADAVPAPFQGINVTLFLEGDDKPAFQSIHTFVMFNFVEQKSIPVGNLIKNNLREIQ